AIANGPALVPDPNLILIHDRFSRMDEALAERDLAPVDGVALDIGVSSMQIDQAERGFSFQGDGPLDMRMSGADGGGRSAADIVNEASETELADILYHYGEEKQSRRVARAIVAARPLTRTGELATIVRRALGHRPHDKKDPATRAFQAIRIHVNRELDELTEGLAAAERVLKPGGRLAVVTFHSLEDRLVKRFLRGRSGATPGGSRHLPQGPAGNAPSFDSVGRAVRAGEAELARNPRARSATLRTARRTAAPSWGHDGIRETVR
ncbi:MAG TPA: 16S rRNA (cytosine(1402)-N(4))-methyltransferase RsmH, partial [Sphingomonas sp.]